MVSHQVEKQGSGTTCCEKKEILLDIATLCYWLDEEDRRRWKIWSLTFIVRDPYREGTGTQEIDLIGKGEDTQIPRLIHSLMWLLLLVIVESQLLEHCPINRHGWGISLHYTLYVTTNTWEDFLENVSVSHVIIHRCWLLVIFFKKKKVLKIGWIRWNSQIFPSFFFFWNYQFLLHRVHVNDSCGKGQMIRVGPTKKYLKRGIIASWPVATYSPRYGWRGSPLRSYPIMLQERKVISPMSGKVGACAA